MKKRMTYEQKKDQSLKDIINKMFEIAGHETRYDDLIGRTDDWFMKYTMTEKQYDEWKSWSEQYLRKNLKMTKLEAGKNMGWIGLMYGLRVSDLTK
jgi:hypothetical protein